MSAAMMTAIALAGTCFIVASAAPTEEPPIITTDPSVPTTIPGSYIVWFHGNQKSASEKQLIRDGLRKAAENVGANCAHEYNSIDAVNLRGLSAEAADKLASHPDVSVVVPDTLATTFDADALELINALPGPGAGEDFLPSGIDGSNANVCVVDSGIRSTHNFFGGRVSITSSGPIMQDFVDSDYDPSEDGTTWHGTHVAGTAAGGSAIQFSTCDAGFRTARGTAPAATIIPMRVVGPSGAAASDITAAIEACVTLDADVINLSLGVAGARHVGTCAESPSHPDVAAINAAWTSGVITVVASGNNNHNGGLSIPACAERAVSVGSVYDGGCDNGIDRCTIGIAEADQRTCHSNAATSLSLTAPGTFIVSAFATSDDSFARASGTSSAAPHVAGLVALLASAHPIQSRTEARAEQIMDIIYRSAQRFSDRATHGLGRVDAAEAVAYLQHCVNPDGSDLCPAGQSCVRGSGGSMGCFDNCAVPSGLAIGGTGGRLLCGDATLASGVDVLMEGESCWLDCGPGYVPTATSQAPSCVNGVFQPGQPACEAEPAQVCGRGDASFNFARLGDGICDHDSASGFGLYNTPECGYDGGDCCRDTCVGASCGATDADFPSCRDPGDCSAALTRPAEGFMDQAFIDSRDKWDTCGVCGGDGSTCACSTCGRGASVVTPCGVGQDTVCACDFGYSNLDSNNDCTPATFEPIATGNGVCRDADGGFGAANLYNLLPGGGTFDQCVDACLADVNCLAIEHRTTGSHANRCEMWLVLPSTSDDDGAATCLAKPASVCDADLGVPCVCPVGQENVAGTACTSCQAGFFKDEESAALCSACSPACQSPAVEVTSCTAATDRVCDPLDCGAGHFDNGGTCTECPAGSYQPNNAQTSCITCTGTGVVATGATASTTLAQACECQAGFEGTAPSCTGCQAGQFESNGVCQDCEAGSYQPSFAQTSCIQCPSPMVPTGQTGSATINDACSLPATAGGWQRVDEAHDGACLTNGEYGQEGTDFLLLTLDITLCQMACDSTPGCVAIEHRTTNNRHFNRCELWLTLPDSSTDEDVQCLLKPVVECSASGERCSCDAGFENVFESECSPCSLGTFKAQAGTDLCQPCSTCGAGFSESALCLAHQNRVCECTSPPCTSTCQPGQFDVFGNCFPCAAGTFQPSAGQPSCIACSGTHVIASGTTGSSSETEACVCEAGTTGNAPTCEAWEPATEGREGTCRTSTDGHGTQDVTYLLRSDRTLEQCQAECLAQEGCVAIEHRTTGAHANRCELWLEFPHHSGLLRDAQCLLVPDGWVDIGSGPCLTADDGYGTADQDYVLVPGETTLEDCRDLCLETQGCLAIEHRDSGSHAFRCELWMILPDHTNGQAGITCSRPVL